MCALISLLWGVGGYVLYLYCFVHGSRHCGESVFSLKPANICVCISEVGGQPEECDG